MIYEGIDSHVRLRNHNSFVELGSVYVSKLTYVKLFDCKAFIFFGFKSVQVMCATVPVPREMLHGFTSVST